eukprot:TRINITY_DN14280_c0_g1_i1.p1 TRINITY_DN14280_c0_g1~~TRINITY_DN14280_c0_g1_i1.p1  ORF type:complete len:433 (+),score=74.55 TRINITY_DN14280_c0_g1_i1:60-1358(+)
MARVACCLFVRMLSLLCLALCASNAGAGADLGFPYPPDTRPQGCPKFKRKDFANHTVSIIIPWLSESWYHMEGTMRALVKMTPDSLVEEFLWISDGNPDAREAELKAISPKVRVFSFEKRQGLIRAKMKGVELATAPVIVFFEAHCIPNRHWLQHILHRVVQNPKALAMPMLDMIPQTDFTQYNRISPGHWRYEWNFNLIYTNPGGYYKDGQSEPYATPGTSGGIFAMRKDWFQRLALFDDGMHEWGGDHMELTMKVWRCGGRIEIVPCSRVGHLYRDPEHRPYDVEVNTVVHNYKRLALLWAKDHLDLFFKMKPEAVNMKLEGMEKVQANYAELERELQCKNLSWYLDNIDHEMKWEMSRICHPYAKNGDPIKCKGRLVPGRWTITQEMPGKEYKRVRAEADARAAEEKAASASVADLIQPDALTGGKSEL